MKTILMILQSEFPPDIRLEKEIKTLHEGGFKVILLCNSYSKSIYPSFSYGSVIRIKSIFNSPKLNKMLNFPLFFNPRLIYYSIKIFQKEKPDFIHVHDLPMFPIGYLLKKLYKKKLVLDFHENYPAALRAYKKKGLFNFLFKNPYLSEKLERISVKKADKIITVIEENESRMISDYKVERSKFTVVSNTVDIETFGIEELDRAIIKKYKDKFVLIYAGRVSPERGLETPIMGMKDIILEKTNALFLIIGNGISVEPLVELTHANNLSENVKFIPWVGHSQINTYMKLAKIGVITHPVEDFINTTITHKLFEYMSQSLAVVVSESTPFKRILKETNAGLLFKSEDPKDFANKIIEISESNINYGENGRKAVEEKFNWDNDTKRLIALYQNM